jgi:Uma2 family endonuclease
MLRPAHAILAEVLPLDSLQAIEPDQIRPLKRVEYDKLVELGVFEDEPIELLYGMLVAMSPIGTPHCSAVQVLTEQLILKLAGRASLRPQLPYAAGEYSEPEPDLLVVPRDLYRDAHPSQAFLAIEVSESSLKKDRGIKARLYAECGVPEYWVVNLIDRRIEVMTEPRDGRYSSEKHYAKGESVAVGAFPDIVIAVDDVIG